MKDIPSVEYQQHNYGAALYHPDLARRAELARQVGFWLVWRSRVLLMCPGRPPNGFMVPHLSGEGKDLAMISLPTMDRMYEGIRCSYIFSGPEERPNLLSDIVTAGIHAWDSWNLIQRMAKWENRAWKFTLTWTLLASIQWWVWPPSRE